MAVAPDSILGTAISTVTQQINSINQLGDTYGQKLSSALANIGGINLPDISPPKRPDIPSASPPSINPGAIPTFRSPNLTMGSDPGNFSIDISGLDIGGLGAIPNAPGAPLINIPEAPGMASIPLPARPTVDTSVAIPDAPSVSLPDMEALHQISLPSFEFPQLPTFDAAPPSASGISVPNVFINWAEPEYKSELLEELQDKVRRMMAGGTGLPAPVEEAIFSRARERVSAETSREVQEAVDTWASRDFSMPPGMLVKAADVAREKGRVAAAEINRDVFVQAGQWEIENIRFAVQQGIALEQLTTNLYENLAKRLFEVARFEAESQINVFNAKISLFNAQNSAFETMANVYRTRIEGAIAKITAYKAAVEGQAVVGQINQQKVEVFKARIDAVLANVEVYKAMVQGASVRAEAIKNQFDAYRSDVQAYAEQIGAEKVKFDAYEARIKGEQAKAGVFDSQARAYASTVQAITNQGQIKVQAAQVKMEAARVRIDKYQADVEGYKARIQASLGNVQAATNAFDAQVRAFSAAAAVNVSDAEMKARFADMTTRTNIAFAEMQIGEYGTKSQYANQQASISLEAAKAVGQYTAQLAAGAMSAAHVSASISGSGSASSSDSRSISTSTNHNYNY